MHDAFSPFLNCRFLETYNSLTDENLAGHFANPRKRRYLRQMGLVSYRVANALASFYFSSPRRFLRSAKIVEFLTKRPCGSTTSRESTKTRRSRERQTRSLKGRLKWRFEHDVRTHNSLSTETCYNHCFNADNGKKISLKGDLTAFVLKNISSIMFY